MRLPNHVRQRTHSLQLPSYTTRLSDSNFITRMLYKDKYYAHNSWTFKLLYVFYLLCIAGLRSDMPCIDCWIYRSIDYNIIVADFVSFSVCVDPDVSVRNLSVTYVNDSSLRLSWLPPSRPASVGLHSYQVNCDNCESTVTFLPARRRINSTTSVPSAVFCSSF